MHSQRLNSVLEILTSNDNELIETFQRINGIKLKEHEKSGFCRVMLNLLKEGVRGSKASGYFINLISNNLMQEEFDLLRFAEHTILNIEIKSTMSQKGISNQMQRHAHLLRTLDKKVFCVTYIEDEDALYQYDNDLVRRISFSDLIPLIEDNYIDDNLLDSVDVSTILVSPYSQPDAFLEHKYFLTNQQEEFKRSILSTSSKHISISGKAGSGKSLLLFDIARSYKQQGYAVCIVFCANLNRNYSISERIGIPVVSIKDFIIEGVNEFDVVLFDEAQRLRIEQYNSILETFNGNRIIFSLDQQQTLHRAEKELNIEEKVKDIPGAENYTLSNRIRINSEVESFAEKLLFYNCPHWHPISYRCIKLSYFINEDSLSDYCREKNKAGVTIIEITPYTTKQTNTRNMPKLFSLSEDSHSVIGQEYDQVIVILNKYFTYKKNSEGDILLELDYPNFYPYDANRCIWEAVSRTRKSLEIIVVDNNELYNKIGKILVR